MTKSLVTKQQPHHEFIGSFLAQKCIYACHSRQFCRSLFIRIMFLYFGLFTFFLYTCTKSEKSSHIQLTKTQVTNVFFIYHSSTEKMKSSQYQFPFKDVHDFWSIFFFLSFFSVYNYPETHFLLSTNFRAMFCLHWFNYPPLWSVDNLCPGTCYLYWAVDVLKVIKIQTKQQITHSPFY